ncbi:hypothetical protein SAMN02746065_101299 [Desulfocicer vacuolatum DSM 3385]|uniref:ResB-like family protein n=1 Tax=Desulfocicer vacuolatum DSM 3385 TaxID=1121400 RepID=A0A1W1YSZ7_9BACT|nr:hypothetical protein [Desulfocicer vacuolatum]SMC38921.1 hypothetical protein SAMN02746065_101299 [Desulfocicer vacuolatum DSM 3385]
MKIIHAIWFFCGHIHLTLVIIGLMMLDLFAGYHPLKHHPEFFAPINDVGFYKWSMTYGVHYLKHTFWLFMLVGLLASLSINTFVCTTQRMTKLIRHRSAFSTRIQFVLRLSPHIIHYSMLLMFLGYLISYLCAGTHMGKVLLPGTSISLATPACTITLEKLDIDYYRGDRIANMAKRAINVTAVIAIKNDHRQKRAVLGFNQPIYFSPISIHLKDFAPKTSGGMGRRRFIHVIIKNDPGKYYYFAGMLFFTLGLFMYLWEKRVKNGEFKIKQTMTQGQGQENRL